MRPDGVTLPAAGLSGGRAEISTSLPRSLCPSGGEGLGRGWGRCCCGVVHGHTCPAAGRAGQDSGQSAGRRIYSGRKGHPFPSLWHLPLGMQTKSLPSSDWERRCTPDLAPGEPLPCFPSIQLGPRGSKRPVNHGREHPLAPPACWRLALLLFVNEEDAFFGKRGCL